MGAGRNKDSWGWKSLSWVPSPQLGSAEVLLSKCDILGSLITKIKAVLSAKSDIRVNSTTLRPAAREEARAGSPP